MLRKMVLFLSVLATAGLLSAEQGSPIRPASLTCENLVNPVGIDKATPLLSWKFTEEDTPPADYRQTAYRIRVASDEEELAGESSGALLWDSGWVESDRTRSIPYAGKELESNRIYYWNVRVRDNKGNESNVSDTASWSTALLDPAEWTAEWIGTGEDFSNAAERPFDPWFRKRFTLRSCPKHAFLHLASVGYHELRVNGNPVDDAVLSPCATDHLHRARYITYDIAPFLREGENVIGVWLGAGWSVFPDYADANRPNAPIFLAQCDIGEGETATRLITDSSWKHAPSGNKLLGDWRFARFGGEYQDGDVSTADWALPDYDDSDWKTSEVYAPRLLLSAQMVEKNRPAVLLTPVSIEKVDDEIWRVDMGRNFAGITQIAVNGEPGNTVEFAFSESPLAEKTFNLASQVKIGKDGTAVFKNRFNYSSGRWITIYGLQEEPKPEQIRGWMVRTDYEPAASFECSDNLQNWIYNTVLWTYENLSLGGYIVDCPQRERMGYGGDAHATCETGMLNYRLDAFYKKWMEDWRDVQGWHQAWLDDTGNINPGEAETALRGTLPNTAPTYFGAGGPAWGGIVITLPWFYYNYYGDTQILSENFELITRWLDFLQSYVSDGLLRRYGDELNFLGDWLWPGAPDGVDPDLTERLCLNNMYRVFNLRTAAKIARTLGNSEKETEWLALAEEARGAINRTYFNPDDASYASGHAALLAAALLAEIPADDQRESVQQRLEREILVHHEGHVCCGITGGALLFKYLREEGRDDLIYAMASKTDYPGWGFMRENGATTMWEAWELNRPYHSLLHSSFLYVGSWYIDSVLGIRNDPEDAGYRKIMIRPPKPDATQLEWARGHFDAPTGKIGVDWKKDFEAGAFRLKVTVPVNTAATVCVPSKGSTKAPDEATWVRDVPGYGVYRVPSGEYEFHGVLK